MKTVQQFLPGLGKTVEVSGLKVKDFDLLTNQNKMASGDALNEMFINCAPKDLDTNKLLSGDRNALLIGIRRATFGESYEFSVVSPYQQSKKPQVFEVDLSQLEYISGDKEKVEAHYADPDYTFLYKFQCGKSAKVRLTDGSDFKKAMTILRGENKATQDLLMRIKEVSDLEGVPLKRFLAELDAEEMLEFNEWYAPFAPAVDDKVILTCQETGQEFTAKLEFNIENFFKRSSRKKTS